MKYVLLFMALALTLNSCNSDDDDHIPTNPIDQLPPPTQNGENTFGFLLNNQPINVTSLSQQVAIYQGGILQLGGGIDNANMDIHVIINVSEPLSLNEVYDLTNTPNNLAIFVNNGLNCYYDYPNTIDGSLTLTNFNQTNYVVSGTFEFSTVNELCEPVYITNGRFDMQYIP